METPVGGCPPSFLKFICWRQGQLGPPMSFNAERQCPAVWWSRATCPAWLPGPRGKQVVGGGAPQVEAAGFSPKFQNH